MPNKIKISQKVTQLFLQIEWFNKFEEKPERCMEKQEDNDDDEGTINVKPT